jgi:hypothetical protein
VAVGLLMARHTATTTRASLLLLVEIVEGPAHSFGGAPNTALVPPSEVLSLSARISPRSPKQSCGCPVEGLTSKGWMPEWSCRRGGPLGIPQPLGVIRVDVGAVQELLLLLVILLLRPAHRVRNSTKCPHFSPSSDAARGTPGRSIARPARGLAAPRRRERSPAPGRVCARRRSPGRR